MKKFAEAGMTIDDMLYVLNGIGEISISVCQPGEIAAFMNKPKEDEDTKEDIRYLGLGIRLYLDTYDGPVHIYYSATLEDAVSRAYKEFFEWENDHENAESG
jgi:hypothetical protein